MFYIIHHNDLDGIASAAVFYLLNDELDSLSEKEYEFVKMDHGQNIDLEKLKEGDKVYILDFSFKPKIMEQIQEIIGEHNLIWIDHHKSIIDEIDDYGLEVKGLQDCKSQKSGAYLTWEYFSDEEPPMFVKMVSAFDVWDKKNDHYMNGLLLNSLFRTLDEVQVCPKFPLYKKLMESDDIKNSLWQDVLDKGETVFNFIKASSKTIVENSEIVEWEGLKCLVGNVTGNGSLSFLHAMDINGEPTEEKYKDIDALISFSWNKKGWGVGMYHGPRGAKNNVDLSLIAKKYGGGGHPGACGCKMEKIPWAVQKT